MLRSVSLRSNRGVINNSDIRGQPGFSNPGYNTGVAFHKHSEADGGDDTDAFVHLVDHAEAPAQEPLVRESFNDVVAF